MRTPIRIRIVVAASVLLLASFGLATLRYVSASSLPDVFDSIENSLTGLTTSIYKDHQESNPNLDYYVVEVRLKEKPNQGVLASVVNIVVPSYAKEFAVNSDHQPKAGDAVATTITFGYGSLSIGMAIGGYHTTYTYGQSNPSHSLRYFTWNQDAISAPGIDGCRNAWWDYAEYAVGLIVPQGMGLFAYANGAVLWEDSHSGGAPWCYDSNFQTNLGWSYTAMDSGGGADGFYTTQPESPPVTVVRGVADAPDSGAGLTLGNAVVGGIIGGFTGAGDTSTDTVDTYQVSVAARTALRVTLDVNNADKDLCGSIQGRQTCSNTASDTASEVVNVYNIYSTSQTVTINVNLAGTQAYGIYELSYQSVSPTLTATITPGSQTVLYHSPCVLPTATFTGSASGGSGSYAYDWTFGDGATDWGQYVSHTYPFADATWTVTLRVSDTNGAWGMTTGTVYVQGTQYC